MKIIAALPAYNEENSIGSVVLRAKKHVNKVIVVDDGSIDATSEIAELAGAMVVKHEKNMGKGVAIKTAFSMAIKLNADILVVLDADGQHNPDEIPNVIAPILNREADMVNGSRFLSGKSNVPRYRQIGQNILTKVTNVGGGFKITDSQNGFRAFSKNTFNAFKFKQKRMGIESEMLIDAARNGLRIVEVPISCRYDVKNGSTYNPVSHGLDVLNSLMSQVQRKHPLLYFGVPGMIMFAIGLILGFQTLYGYKVMDQFWIGKALMAIIFTLLGTFACFTAMILNSISTLIENIK